MVVSVNGIGTFIRVTQSTVDDKNVYQFDLGLVASRLKDDLGITLSHDDYIGLEADMVIKGFIYDVIENHRDQNIRITLKEGYELNDIYRSSSVTIEVEIRRMIEDFITDKIGKAGSQSTSVGIPQNAKYKVGDYIIYENSVVKIDGIKGGVYQIKWYDHKKGGNIESGVHEVISDIDNNSKPLELNNGDVFSVWVDAGSLPDFQQEVEVKKESLSSSNIGGYRLYLVEKGTNKRVLYNTNLSSPYDNIAEYLWKNAGTVVSAGSATTNVNVSESSLVGKFFYGANGKVVSVESVNNDKLELAYFFPIKGQDGYEVVKIIYDGVDKFLDAFKELNLTTGDEFLIHSGSTSKHSKYTFKKESTYDYNLLKDDGYTIVNRDNPKDVLLFLWERGAHYIIPNAPSQENEEDESLTEVPASTYEAEIEQLNKDIAQLMFFKSILSPIDFEKKIEISQEIQSKQKRVNDLNFYLLEKKIQGDNIFEELFEQSFTPISNAYSGVYAVSPDETDFFTPNGQKSKLSDALNLMIRTPQFKAWFGDWELAYLYRDTDAIEIECSKVLTDNFEPLVVWHGTGQEFSYFRFDTFPAAYFAVRKEYSQFFADLHGEDGGYVIPFFLNIRNPLDLTHFGTKDIPVKDFFDYIFLQTGMDMDDLGVNPLFLDPSVKPMQTWIYIRNNPNMLKKLASLNMFDGIRFYETNPNVKDKASPAFETEAFITFNPNQSKIADPNRGMVLLASMKSFLLEKGGKI